MKKAKILALVLVAALMLTGGAYAYWNQSINLSTSAATGFMEADITCGTSVKTLSSMPALDLLGTPDKEDYMNLSGSVAANDHGVQVTVTKLYPGAKYGINYTVKNKGTVPFSLSDVKFSCSQGSDLFAKFKGGFKFIYNSLALHTSTTITVPDTSFASPDDVKTALMNALSGIILYPGDQLSPFTATPNEVGTTMYVTVDPTITGDQNENETTVFNVEFDWQQCPTTYHS